MSAEQGSDKNTAQASPDMIDHVARAVAREMLLLGSPFGALLSVYYALWGELTRAPSRYVAVGTNLATFLVAAVIMFFVGRRYLRGRLRRAATWIIESRASRSDDARAVAALPLRLRGVARPVSVAVPIVKNP